MTILSSYLIKFLSTTFAALVQKKTHLKTITEHQQKTTK